MKTILLLVGLMALAFSVVGAGEKAPALNDDEISKAVEQTLKSDEKLSGAAIEAETENGVVTLTGKVLGRAEAERAVTVARRVPGVARVESKLEIDTYITNEDVEDRRKGEEEALDAEKDKNEPDRPAGTVLDDAGITSSVKWKLAKDDVVSALKIDVDTKSGEVTLTGTVNSELEARRAVELAESVDGVRRVTSVLTVKPE